mgnify:FL=1|nr:MAG TPA: hypothetical protein [Caudoviricetes sp.]
MHVYEMGVINMLNAEKYKNEILEKSNVVFDFSISKDRHTIEKCLGVCDNCIFCNIGEHCSNVKVKWLLSEYKEPVKLIRVEHEILRYLYKRDYRYIAREESERVIAFKGRPHKITCGTWNTISDEKIGFLNLYDFSNLFQFTDWKDLESTSIEDVLKNCEVIDDDL